MSGSSGAPLAFRAHPLAPYDGVLLMSFGGPEHPDEVMPFMRSVTRGRGIPDERLRAVAGHYYTRGGRSPINDENRRLVAALDRELERRGARVPLLWGNRHAAPTYDDAARQAREGGLARLLGVPTSAYPGFASCRSYWNDAVAFEAASGARVDRIRRYAHHPGFSLTNARLVEQAVRALREGDSAPAAAGIRLLFVTHSIPEAMDAGSGPAEADEAGAGEGAGHGYTAEHRALAAAVAAEVGARVGEDLAWDLVFCSRSGPPGQRWLEPDIGDRLRELAIQGSPAVVIAPIGFVADHMEVVWDLDEQAMAVAQEVGLRAVRVPTVGSDPQFVAGLADLLLERAAMERGEDPPRPTWPGGPPAAVVCPAGCCPAPGRPGAGRPDPTDQGRSRP